ncbi:MAG TPA: MbcA/ParS/Xre antitoxin family protein [Roseiarcus sp.]|nr:MbcA/ParS/Xre antitoxin family protein [Roseiarcus sp.]
MPAPPQLESPKEQAAVVAKAALRAATQLKIPNRLLAQIIGVSEASVSRAAQGAFRLDGKPLELALLFIRLFRSLDAIVGGDAATAASWIRADNIALGAKPIDLIQRVPGLTDVIAYLDARRAIV